MATAAEASTSRHNIVMSNFETMSDGMDASMKFLKTGFLTIGVLASTSFAGTAYLIFQSLS